MMPVMSPTKASREAARERAAAVAAAAEALDPVDRHLLDLEYMVPGPHAEAVGMTEQEYAVAVRRLIDDPVAAVYAKTVIERLRAEYG